MSFELNPIFLHFSKWLKKKSEKKAIVLTFLLLFISFNVLVFPFFISHFGLQGKVILDLSPGFSPDTAYEAIYSYGGDGRNGVLFITGVVDMIYPLAYSMLLILLISRLHQYSSGCLAAIKQLHLAPLFIILFDFIENVGIITMIGIFPNRNDPVSMATSFFGVLKWSFVLISITLILLLTIRYLTTFFLTKR